MRIAVIGTGSFGRTLAQALQRIGHDVAVGTRDPSETSQREEWAGVDVPLQQLAVVAGDADLVVNATNGGASLAALGEVGSDHLAGKVLLDVANPLDFSQGFPPMLSVKDTDSLAEQIQRAFPDARVVKALNTLNVSVAVDPDLGRRRGHHRLRGQRRRRRRVRSWSGCCASSAGWTSSSSTG